MKKFFGLLLLLIFLFASEMNMVAEVDGATCEKPSQFFKGPCGTHEACRQSCTKENWPVGVCDFFKCKCQRPC